METQTSVLLILLILSILVTIGIIIYFTMVKRPSSGVHLITPIPTTITRGGQILGTVTYTGHSIAEFGAVISTAAMNPVNGTTVSLYDGDINGTLLGTITTKSQDAEYITTNNVLVPKTKTIIIGTGVNTDPGTAQLITLQYS